MAISRIEQLIEEIYEFIESCKMQPFSSTKVIVPKDELYDLLDELRIRTPDEIKRYKKIIAQRDAILDDAEEKAKAIVADADNRAISMINEHEIMQLAYDQANELVNNANGQADRILTEANYEANQIRANSLGYTEELLNGVENIVLNTYNQTNQDYEALSKHLKETLEIIKDNKGEISNSTGQEDKEIEDDLDEKYEALDENLEDDYSDKEYFDDDDDSFLDDLD